MRVASVRVLHAVLGRLSDVEDDIALLDRAERSLSINRCRTNVADGAAYDACVKLRTALRSLRLRQPRLAALCDGATEDVRDGCYAINDWFLRSNDERYQGEIAFRGAA